MEVTLINRNTASIIPTQSIVEQTDDGVVVNIHNCWKLIPTEQVGSEYQDTEYYTAEPLPIKKEKTDYNPFLAYSESPETQYTEKMEYRFGFHGLQISTKQTAAASGIISNPISVATDIKVTVTAEIENPEAGSVEISVLDNTDEIPILYNGSRAILKERLFYGVPTRFIPNQDQPVVLYEDNLPVTKDYTLLSPEEYQNHIYTLSYTALNDALYYKPVSNKIQLKIVIRQYDTDTFIAVQHILLHKDKEPLTWNLNQ